MYERILVPIDFSARAAAALARADELAVPLGASLTLAHVRPFAEQVLMDTVHVDSPDELGERLRGIEARLEQLAAPLACRDTDTLVLQGDPVRVLIKSSSKYDLIVMSTHGRDDLSDFLLGSTTERVVRGAHCSVLVVR